jgi:hypothetical protein
MAQLTAAGTVAAVDRTIHDVGSICMLDEETTGRWKRLGFKDPPPSTSSAVAECSVTVLMRAS